MGAVAVQLGVFFYALLATFVSSAMSGNARENRPNSGMITMVGWGLCGFSTSAAAFLFAAAAAMAAGFLPEDAISF